MRLKKLKLAGFKSFVDPTVLEFRSPIVAVVGPNGCGKSNIIDAVRWVMGESSAKNLRGESMADVIFNGSTGRKPVGQATIEMVFDNADGSLGGEYAQFSEISVRRQATRDGQSAYFLNGTRCRRKDITDVFLGTGLGPRSYSIIEQGMISRVIEAKPEDLRAFLEEAAGVSIYRKRRQETETRMRHTRENLERLDDLRQELDKQLDRLKRQAESALKFKEYQAEQECLDAELSALRWNVLNTQLEAHNSQIRVLSVNLEEKLAERSNVDLELEKLRLDHIEKTDVWKVKQGQFYDIGTQIARIEQTIQHHRERSEALQADYNQTEQHYRQICSQIEEDEIRLETLKEDLLKVSPDFETYQTQAKQSEEIRLEAEEAMRQWSSGFESFQQEAAKSQQSAEVEKARIEQLEKQSREAKAQLDRLYKEQTETNTQGLEQQLQQLELELQTLEEQAEGSANELTILLDTLTEAREALSQQTTVLEEKRSSLQKLKGRQATLEALQQAALGKTDGVVKEWLELHHLIDFPRLAEIIKVETGFEQAVETVLGHALEAVCVSGNSMDALNRVAELTQGELMVIDSVAEGDAEGSDKGGSSSGSAGLLSLLQKVKLKDHQSNTNTTGLSRQLNAWLKDVFVVDELSEALEKRKYLTTEQSIVTKAGLWIGTHWFRVHKGAENDVKSAHSGVLAREAELKELMVKIETLEELVDRSEEEVNLLKENIKSLELKRETQYQMQQQHARVASIQTAKISAERAKLEHQKNRLAQLQTVMVEQNQKLQLAEEDTALARVTLQSALDEMEIFTKKRASLQTEKETLRQVLQQASLDERRAKDTMHEIKLKHQNLTTQQQLVDEGLHRLNKQKTDNQERQNNLKHQLQNLEDPQKEHQSTLEGLLVERIQSEETLNQARILLDELEQNLRALEKRRNVIENEALETRNQLEKCRMDWQALEVRGQTVHEKLAQVGKTIEEILATMPADAEESVWAERLEQLTKKIERLGAINLAAIEECQTEQERKTYLDSQHKDLTEALETLENAIRKIDKETRARFKETFEKVNDSFQVLFPKLFGGGQANLELVGEEILEAGVTVMARPPGKRNSSIHLLSGGEKALTAVALVFSIFQLNPAPFCLLDEVDAPLDDANVGRFCEMVKQMSSSVQFVVVTHNKLAMEMAHHLVGVTMKEPGVSRLVSVDVEEAAALVAS